MEVKEVNIDELEVEDISEYDLSESIDLTDLEKIQNIVFSYPYLYKGTLEHQFRLSFVDNDIVLDEIVYNEDDTQDVADCIISETNILKKPYEHVIKLMKQNIDIRDEVSVLENEILENKEENIDENKKVVLKELYKTVLESVLDN